MRLGGERGAPSRVGLRAGDAVGFPSRLGLGIGLGLGDEVPLLLFLLFPLFLLLLLLQEAVASGDEVPLGTPPVDRLLGTYHHSRSSLFAPLCSP